MSQEQILFLEELALNAWPSLQTVVDDGWILRFADGYTGRANSVNILYPSTDNLESKIARCEARYTARGLPTTFKMTPATQPANLDSILESRGYELKRDTMVKTAQLDGLPAPEAHTVTLTSDVSDDWMRVFCALRDMDEHYLPIMGRILNNIISSVCYATLWQGDMPAAVGLAVAERGYVGLFDITTAPGFRNRGLGRQLVLHLLRWGQANGATQSYLQVMSDNAPALRLYDKLGFRDVYPYWYRVKVLTP